MNCVGRIAERQIERDGQDNHGDGVQARRHGRSERDADETADGLDVQGPRDDIGEPIPAAACRVLVSPLGARRAPRARGEPA